MIRLPGHHTLRIAACCLAFAAGLGPVRGIQPAAARGPADVSVDPAVLEAEARRVEAIRTASATAVAVFAGTAGGGSAVLISPDGYALTNFHVVQPAGVAMTCGLSDGRLYEAVLVGLDPTGDVAAGRRLTISVESAADDLGSGVSLSAAALEK